MESLPGKSVDERWKNETSQWVGSNYLCATCNISYLNNPFGYIHHEEQYVTNLSDINLLDYPFTNSDPNLSKKIVIATYELNYKRIKQGKEFIDCILFLSSTPGYCISICSTPSPVIPAVSPPVPLKPTYVPPFPSLPQLPC